MIKDKTTLRREIRVSRGQMSRSEVARISDAVSVAILAHPWFERAQVVAGYWAKPSEVSLEQVLIEAGLQGKDVFLPIVQTEPGSMGWGRFDDPFKLQPGPHGILEPVSGVVETPEFDIIFVPALATSATGFRIGWGGGYYDRFLAGGRSGRSVAVVPSQWSQIQFPTEEHDVSCDAVVTERGFNKTSRVQPAAR